jgi:VIT1/CCC1 family predicted Fe2+/Mn2+ transporter
MEQEKLMKKIEDHVRTAHKQTPISAYLKEVVYGGVDGIITTFAIVAGFSGAALSNETTTQLSFVIVLLFGLANLFADGVSMGLGNFLSVRSEQSQYYNERAKEQKEAIENTEWEIKETIGLLLNKGLSKEDAETLAHIYKKYPNYWVDFMMVHELKTPDPTGENPVYTGLATFLSFVFFGFIPLSPFIFLSEFDSQSVFWVSACAAFLALLLLGVLKWRVIGSKFFSTVIEVVLVGGIAALIAFYVGSLFTI